MMKFGLVMGRQMVRCYCALSIATCGDILFSSIENFLKLVQKVAAHGSAHLSLRIVAFCVGTVVVKNGGHIEYGC